MNIFAGGVCARVVAIVPKFIILGIASLGVVGYGIFPAVDGDLTLEFVALRNRIEFGFDSLPYPDAEYGLSEACGKLPVAAEVRDPKLAVFGVVEWAF